MPNTPDPNQSPLDFALTQLRTGNVNPQILDFLQQNRAQITDQADLTLLDEQLNPTPGQRSRLRRAAPWVAGAAGLAGLVGLGLLYFNRQDTPIPPKPPIVKGPDIPGVPPVPPVAPVETPEEKAAREARELAERERLEREARAAEARRLEELVAQATPLKVEFDKYAAELKNVRDHPFRHAFTDPDKYVRRAVRTADKAIAQNLDDVLHRKDANERTFHKMKDDLISSELDRLVPNYSAMREDFFDYESAKLTLKKSNPSLDTDELLEARLKATLVNYERIKRNHDNFARLQQTWQDASSDQDRFVARKVQWFEDLRLNPWDRLEAQLLRNAWSYAEETAEEIGKIFDKAQETKARNRISGDRLEYSASQKFDLWNFNKNRGGDQRREAEDALELAYELIDKARKVDAAHVSIYDRVKQGFVAAETAFKVEQFKRDIDNLYSALDQDALDNNVDVVSQAKDLVDRIQAPHPKDAARSLTDAQKTELSEFNTKIAKRYWNRRFDREMLKASELAQNGRWEAAYWHTVAAVATQPSELSTGMLSGLDLLSATCTKLKIEGNDYTPEQSQAILDELLTTAMVNHSSNVGQALAMYRDNWKNKTATAYEGREAKATKELKVLQPQLDAKLADLKAAENDATRSSELGGLRTTVSGLQGQIGQLKEELNYESNVRFSQNAEKVVNSTVAVPVRIVYRAGETVYNTGKGLVNLIRAPFARSVTAKDAGQAFKDAGSSLLDVPDAALAPARLAKGAVLGSAEQIPYAGRAFGYVRDVTPLQDPWAEDNSNSRLIGNPFGANNGPRDGYRWIEAHYGRAYANAAVVGSVVSDAAIIYALQQALEGGHATGRGPVSTGPKPLSGGSVRGPGVVPAGQ